MLSFLVMSTAFGAAEWKVAQGSHCYGTGGALKNPESVKYGWKPNAGSDSASVAACKAKCEADVACVGFTWRSTRKDCFWKTKVEPALNRYHDCYYMDEPATAGVVAPAYLTPAELNECHRQCMFVECAFAKYADHCEDNGEWVDYHCGEYCLEGKIEWYLDDGTKWSPTNRMSRSTNRMSRSTRSVSRLERLLLELEKAVDGRSSEDLLTEEQLRGIKKCEELTDNGCDACLVDMDCQYNKEKLECVYGQTADEDVPESSWAFEVEQCPGGSTSGCARFSDCTKCLDESDYKCLYDRSLGCVEAETASFETAFWDSSKC